MKTINSRALILGVILAFASSGTLQAAPSIPITEPPGTSASADGPPIDPFSVAGQWFMDLTSGGEEVRSYEFHDNVGGFGGGGASYAAISGVVTSITYVAGPGTDIISFTVLATIINDTDTADGSSLPGDNSHSETNTVTSNQHCTLFDAKLVAEFALSETGKVPTVFSGPYRDPGLLSDIIADNEEQWAWYCWNPTNVNVPDEAGDYYVPAWDFGVIPPGSSSSRTLVFTCDPPIPPPPPIGPPTDPRYIVIVDSEEFGADIFANRSTSLKISTWIDDLEVDTGSDYDEPVLRNSDVSVFHNIIPGQQDYDWGDAPAVYPTLFASGGAFHSIAPGALLGALVDPEPDGQPNLFATGDDIAALDDEDGVLFTSALIKGTTASVTVTASAGGSFLQGWVDFTKDGDWTDSGEQIFTDVPLSGGPTSLVYSVPGGAASGITFARFRLSTDLGVPSTGGPAPNGEVEDYRVLVADDQAEFDFGDAPDSPYPTLIANGGAGHAIVPTVLLGTLIDAEFDGLPDSMATGDDLTTSPDEDGVIFITDIIAGGTAKIDAINGGGAVNFLDAWIDFNADGDWLDSGEQIFVSVLLVPGLNPSLAYPVPEPLTLGTSFARFRLSSAGGLAPTGMAADGEVEDYEVTLYQPVPSPELEITNFTFTVSNTIANVEWNSQSNILYQLQCSTNLTTNVWVNVGATVLGPINLQTNDTTHTNQFYRVTAPWAK